MKHKEHKLITWIILVLCGCSPLLINAQTSVEHLYNTLTGDGVRLCTDPATGNSIICFNNHADYLPYCFVYHDHSSSSTYYYRSSWGFPPTNTPDYCDVKDIEIIGDSCYFCGSYYTSYFEYQMGGGQMLVTIENGYIGRFSLSNFVNGISPMPIKFFTIPGTKTLSKLVGLTQGPNYFICLIGVTSTGRSCLATVKDDGLYLTYGLHATPASETLTDLALTDDHLVTVSRFDDEPYTFGLRAEITGDWVGSILAGNPLPRYPYLNKYQTMGVNTLPEPRPAFPTAHPMNVEIKLAEVPGTENIVVAYDCTGGARDEECSSDLFHTALYHVDLSPYYPEQGIPMGMLEAQLVSKARKEKNSLAGLACPDQTKTILFHSYPFNSDDYSGEIQFPQWPYAGHVDNLLIDQRDLQDMYYDFSNHKINLAGNPGTDSRILHFQQDYNKTGRSCYSTRPQALAEEMTLPEEEIILTEITTSYGIVSESNTRNRPNHQADYEIRCRTN